MNAETEIETWSPQGVGAKGAGMEIEFDRLVEALPGLVWTGLLRVSWTPR
jgi:hypothetical protein